MITYLVLLGAGIGLLIVTAIRLSKRHRGNAGSDSHFSPSDPGPG